MMYPLVFAFFLLTWILPAEADVILAAPAEALQAIERIDARLHGNLGVYIKDLEENSELAYKADKRWYLSSTTKVPIAIVLLRHVEKKRFTLGDLTSLREGDRVDGMGGINFKPNGTIMSFDYLLEQMIIHSDSAAADILLRVVNPGAVNNFLSETAPGNFGEITSIIDVRREAYSIIHPNARYLPNRAYFTLKEAKTNAEKIAVLESLLGKPKKRFSVQSVDEAFERYYESEKNSGTLRGYGMLLEKLARAQLLTEDHTRYLLRIMTRTATGDSRVKAGMPKGTLFAHKTGTQVARICNVGLVLRDEFRPGKSVVVAACVEKFRSRAEAERALASVGKVIDRYFVKPLAQPAIAYTQKD